MPQISSCFRQIQQRRKYLTRAGHDAVHVQEIGRESDSDAALLDYSASERRVFVTADVKLSHLMALHRRKWPSAIIHKNIQETLAKDLSEMLLKILSRVKADLEAGSVVVIKGHRIRVHKLPIRIVRNHGAKQ